MAQTETLVEVYKPDTATKQLKFRKNGERRILTISSNLLVLFGFEKGDAVIETSLGEGRGIEIKRVQDDLSLVGRAKRVYARRYSQRRNNPMEHQVEVSSQKLLDASFPQDCSRVHIQFKQGCIRVTPIYSVREKAEANARRADPSSVFAALTSGVDLASMRDEGFKISAVLEWRPQEARDKTNLSETGMMAALSNSGPLHAVFNEDITACAVDRIAAVMEKHPVMVFHASPQCDDHSNLKGKRLKQRHHEDGSSSADMIIDLLNVVEKIAPPVIVMENVPGMITSAAYEVASLRLRRWGYRRYEHVGDARDFGGFSSRKRAYVVFSQLDAPFAFEEPSSPREKDVWKVVEPFLSECRDVSGHKSLNDGKACGRLRAVKPGAKHLPTPVKSQSRMAKDSIVIEPTPGQFLWPTENLLKRFLGIENVDLSAVSQTIASEIIGQSIDRPHHAMILRCIKRHIASWTESLRSIGQPSTRGCAA